uniref:Putative ovule protein n=1 Tax=Solanum chacoense TaxID=4108 RepID=A0A0V0GRW0_SOLCH
MKKAFRSPIKRMISKVLEEEKKLMTKKKKKEEEETTMDLPKTYCSRNNINSSQSRSRNAATTSKGIWLQIFAKNADLKQKGAIGVAMTRGGSSLSAATTSTIATDVAIAKTQATIDITQLTQPPI